MERYFLILCYILLLIFSLTLYYKRQKLNDFPGTYNGFMLGSILYYCIVPLVLWLFESYYVDNSWDWKFYRINQFIFSEYVSFGEKVYSILMTFLALFCFDFTYRCIRSRFRERHCYSSTENDLLVSSLMNVVRKYAKISLIIGSVSIIIYIQAFGGISYALELAEALRQHNTSISDYNIASYNSYFLMLAGSLTITPFLYYIVLKHEKKKSNYIYMMISLVFMLLYMVITSGKSPFLRFGLAVAYLILDLYNFKNKWIIFPAGVMILLPVMDGLDALFIQGSILDALDNFSYLHLLKSFAIPVELIYNMEKIVDIYGYSYFKYYITDIVSVIPGISGDASFANTSEFMKGSNWKDLGGTPNDVITYGFIQLRELGVIVVLSLWGILCGYLDNIIDRMPEFTGKKVLSIITSVNFISVITCADIKSTILYNLLFTLTILLLHSIKKNRRLFYEKNGTNNKLYP